MAYRRKFQAEESDGPFCQATGCFEKAAFYVVLKETEEPNYYETLNRKSGIKMRTFSTTGLEASLESDLHFDGFKMIMYFCKRHENDFKYLIRGSELRISKECSLHAPKITR